MAALKCSPWPRRFSMPNCGPCLSADHVSPASVQCRKSPPLRIRSAKADSLSIPAFERDEDAEIERRGDVRMNDLKKLIREVRDYPKPGILFYDLTTLLKDKLGFHMLIDRLCDHYKDHTIDVVAGIEARGFIFAPALAYRLNAGFVPVRKPKKLPAKTASISYALEYGTDTLEIHEDAIKPGQRVIICDDLLATGGTAAATAKLIQQLGGTVEGGAFAVELTFLNGRKKLNGLDVFSLIQYDK